MAHGSEKESPRSAEPMGSKSTSHENVSKAMCVVAVSEFPVHSPDLIGPLLSHVRSFIHPFIFQIFSEPLLNSRPCAKMKTHNGNQILFLSLKGCG